MVGLRVIVLSRHLRFVRVGKCQDTDFVTTKLIQVGRGDVSPRCYSHPRVYAWPNPPKGSVMILSRPDSGPYR